MKHLIHPTKAHIYCASLGVVNVHHPVKIVVKDIVQVGKLRLKVIQVIKTKISIVPHYINHFYFELRFKQLK